MPFVLPSGVVLMLLEVREACSGTPLNAVPSTVAEGAAAATSTCTCCHTPRIVDLPAATVVQHAVDKRATTHPLACTTERREMPSAAQPINTNQTLPAGMQKADQEANDFWNL